jgi:hypothetical protein
MQWRIEANPDISPIESASGVIAVARPAAVAARITATAARRPETTSTERTPSSAQITPATSCPITPSPASGVTTKVKATGRRAAP